MPVCGIPVCFWALCMCSSSFLKKPIAVKVLSTDLLCYVLPSSRRKPEGICAQSDCIGFLGKVLGLGPSLSWGPSFAPLPPCGTGPRSAHCALQLLQWHRPGRCYTLWPNAAQSSPHYLQADAPSWWNLMNVCEDQNHKTWKTYTYPQEQIGNLSALQATQCRFSTTSRRCEHKEWPWANSSMTRFNSWRYFRMSERRRVQLNLSSLLHYTDWNLPSISIYL